MRSKRTATRKRNISMRIISAEIEPATLGRITMRTKNNYMKRTARSTEKWPRIDQDVAWNRNTEINVHIWHEWRMISMFADVWGIVRICFDKTSTTKLSFLLLLGISRSLSRLENLRQPAGTIYFPQLADVVYTIVAGCKSCTRTRWTTKWKDDFVWYILRASFIFLL